MVTRDRRHPGLSARWAVCRARLTQQKSLGTGIEVKDYADAVLLAPRQPRKNTPSACSIWPVRGSVKPGIRRISTNDDSTVMYLWSATYDPAREHGINPLDPELGLTMPEGITPVLSAKDAVAPSLSQAVAQGLLPRYDECLRHYAELNSRA